MEKQLIDTRRLLALIALATGLIAFQLNQACAQNAQSSQREFYTPKEDLDGLKANQNIKASLPNVLLLGDSISIGYTPPVIAELQGIANVKRAKQNCGDTNRGLLKLDAWLGKTKWDVIHFNWGLHDLCYRHPKSRVQGHRDKVNGTQAIPVEQYQKNLDILVERLKKTGAKLIWASTTTVPEKEAGRFVEDASAYNSAAADVMKKHGVPTNDLHSCSALSTEHFKKPGDVHFTKEGYEAIAKKVAESIRGELSSDPSIVR